VGLLENFEQRLDQLVNGPFTRAFKDVVEPVEIASRLQREMDTRAAIISRGRTVVPNAFTVDLSQHDFERLADLAEAIRLELVAVVRQHAMNQRYTFLGAVDVTIAEDPTLETGMIRVRSEAKADAHPPQPPSAPVAAAEIAGHPRLVVGSQSYPLMQSRTRLGRGSGVDITVEDPGVSRAHCEIILGMPSIIRDLGSTNGTAVDGRKVAEAPLHDGAQIGIGNTVLTFRSG
jgi:hypothetical protein